MIYVRRITFLSILAFFLLPFYLTYTNPALAATTGTLNLQTTVVNDNGGNWNPSDFSTSVKQNNNHVTGSPVTGKGAPGNTFTLNPGQYTVSVGPYEKYTTSFGGDCDRSGNILIAADENKTCYITNNDSSPSLHVIVEVINDSGGTLNASDFKVHVKAGGNEISGSPFPGAINPGTILGLSAGTYTISQDPNRSYSQTIGGDCNAEGVVTLSLGNKTCVITNNDISTLAPGLPETGGTGTQICVNSNLIAWIFTGTIVLLAIYFIYKKALPDHK